MSTTAYNKYPKGSEWRRWDLHIHTPETNKNDQFTGSTTEEKWGNFCSTINAYADDISVVGITDYFSIENYFKFKNKINEGAISKHFDLVLPNVELRISPVTGSAIPINIHCIFNPEIENELNDRFFSKLSFPFNGSTYSGTRSELIRLGRSFNGNPSLLENEAYLVGVNQYVIGFQTLLDLFNADSNLRQETIIVVSNSSGDGASGLNHSDFFNDSVSQLDATRRSIYQNVDAVFSANPKDRNYFLGLGPDDIATVITKCGSLKPCIHGSDAHSNDKLFKPDMDRFCWVKADPTFNGLKQMLFEPQERVLIGDTKPDEKLVYQVIEKVKFEDTNFTTNEIELNSNFTAIIGGKSTGKSILLRNIAKTVDPLEFEKRLKTAGLTEQKTINGMEVFWKDGQKSSLGSSDNVDKRIIFIPQSYLNRIVDFDKNRNDIDEIIRDILLQDNGFYNWYSTLNYLERNLNSEIENTIKFLFENIANFYSTSDEIKKIGDENGIKQQITKITDEIALIQSKLELKDDEIILYNSKMETINANKLIIESFEIDKLILTNISNTKIGIYNPYEYQLKNQIYNDKLESISQIKEGLYSSDWKVEIEKIIEEYRLVIEKTIQINTTEIESIANLQKKIDSQKSLQEKYKALTDEKAKDQKIAEVKKRKDENLKNIKQATELLADNCANFYSLYLEAKDKINKDQFDDELKFEIETIFSNDKFQENFVRPFFDGRSLRSGDYNHLTNFEFTNKEDFKNQIKALLLEIINNKLPIRDGFTNKEITSGLIKNWFNHYYKVEYLGDQLNEMSPGKKSFVLLRLLIDLDNSRCPILIDQPEDDLDNRSIYYEVVKFIRRKKPERQIIIATHNPNIVLGADAEQIIVANQQGQDSKNKSSQFEYVSGGIENSFKINEVNEILYCQGIQEHICDILEGGEEAFIKRKNKYRFTS